MINTVLFDLDGTLLGMREKEFMDKYFYELSMKFSDVSDSSTLVNNIWDATKHMVLNVESDKLNVNVFFDRFNGLIDKKHKDIYFDRFNDFYANEFERVKEATFRMDNMLLAVEELKDKGYKLVIATNPLFPKMAIYKRIIWAGLNIEDFDHITNFEDCHYCKPNIEFYKEILHVIDKRPDECIMIGNDTLEDSVAGKLGIKTYIVDDNIIYRENSLNSDYTSNSSDFLKFVKAMPDIKD